MTTKFDPGGFRIIGTDKYEDDVEKQLGAILKNPAGKVLLDFIDANPKYIRIVPYTGGGCDATTSGDNPSDAAPENVKPYAGYGAGARRDAQGTLTPTLPEDKASFTGTGRGSDVHINFSPGTYGGSDCFSGRYGSQADEILFHELVHGFRRMQGLYNPIPTVPNLYSYLNEEEWLAILIANIYISVKNGNNRGLRKDHEGHEELKPPLNAPDGFLKNQDHRKLVQKYYADEYYLSLSLFGVQAPYNPIYEFVANFKKYYQP